MNSFIDRAMQQNRAVLLSLLALLVAGMLVYVRMPKEFYPDVEMPLVNVRLLHFGISPEDSERLLIRPIGRTVYLMPPYLLNEEHVAYLAQRTVATLDATLASCR